MRTTLRKISSIICCILLAGVMAFCIVACGGGGTPSYDNPTPPSQPVNPFDPIEPSNPVDPGVTVPDKETDLDDSKPTDPDEPDTPNPPDTPDNPDTPDVTAPVITVNTLTLNGIKGQALKVTYGTNYSVDDATATITAKLVKQGQQAVAVTVAGDKSITITPDSVGIYTLKINASDEAQNVAIEKSITITVTENVKPVISVVNANVNGEIGVQFSIALGTDFTVTDESTVTISAVLFKPNSTTENISLVGNALAFTPSTVGQYRLVISAYDVYGNVADAKTVTITVADNSAPVITLNKTTVSHVLGSVFTFTRGTDFTVDGSGTLNISATLKKPDNSTENLTFSVNAFAFTPSTTGTYTLTINASNDNGSAEAKVVTINVTENVKPVIAVASATMENVIVGSQVTLTNGVDFSVTDMSDVTITANVRKPDNSTADLTLSSSAFTFIASATGTYTVTIGAVDEFGNVADSKTITIIVIENSQPELSIMNTSISATTNTAVTYAFGTDYTVTGSTNYTVTAVLNGNGITNQAVTVASDKSMTLNVANAGTYTLTITVTDTLGNTDTANVTVTVKEPRPTYYDESGFTGTTNQTSLKLETDSFVTIDGKLTEDCYASQNWFTYTYEGVTVSVTTVFGEQGFYVAFKVLDSHVYALESRSVWMGSSVEMYIERDGEDNKSAQSVQYRLSALDVVEMLKGVETIEDKWKWTYRPIYGLTEVVGGELNSGFTEGLNAEIFVRWDALGYDMNSSSFTPPTRVKIMPVYNQSSGPNTDSQRENWVNNGGEINDPRDYWIFDDTGYVNADKDLAKVGDADFGRAKSAGWDLTEEANQSVSTTIDANKQVIYFKNINSPEYVFTTLVKFDGKGNYSNNPKAGIVLAGNETMQSFLIDYTKTTSATSQGFTFNCGNPDPKETWAFSSAYSLSSLNIDPSQPIRLTGIKVGKYLMIKVGDANTPRYGGTLVTQIEDNLLSGNAAPGLITLDCFATFTDFDASNDPATIAQYTSGVFSVLDLQNQTGGTLSSSATGYAFGTTAKVQIKTNAGKVLTSLTVDGVEKISEIVDGELSVLMDKDTITVVPTFSNPTVTDKGTLQVTVTGKDNFCDYTAIEWLLTDGTSTFQRGGLTTASLLRARNVPYGDYELIFYVNGLLNSRTTVTINAGTVELAAIVLEQKVPIGDGSGAGVSLPAGATYNEADGSISMVAQTNFLMYKYSAGFQFGVSLARNDGEKEVSGTWGTGGIVVVAGAEGNQCLYRILVMRENADDIVVYINNQTNWVKVAYRVSGGKTWGTGAPISFDIAFFNGELRLLVNKSVQYVLTIDGGTIERTEDQANLSDADLRERLNYLFNYSGDREVGICSIDVDITFRNISSKSITEMPTMFTTTADKFTDNSLTSKIDDNTIGIAQGQSKIFSAGTSCTGDYMVSFTAYRADFYVQEGTWDTFGLHLNIGGSAYRVFFIREENHKTAIMYITGPNNIVKECRLNIEVAGTGAEQTLVFVFDVSEGILHISWASNHIKLDTNFCGTEFAQIFSTQSKEVGVFANVSSVFKNLIYSTDPIVINDAIGNFPTTEPTIK